MKGTIDLSHTTRSTDVIQVLKTLVPVIQNVPGFSNLANKCILSVSSAMRWMHADGSSSFEYKVFFKKRSFLWSNRNNVVYYPRQYLCFWLCTKWTGYTSLDNQWQTVNIVLSPQLEIKLSLDFLWSNDCRFTLTLENGLLKDESVMFSAE